MSSSNNYGFRPIQQNEKEDQNPYGFRPAQPKQTQENEGYEKDIQAFEQGVGQTARAVSSAIVSTPRSFSDELLRMQQAGSDYISEKLGRPKIEYKPQTLLPTKEQVEKGFDVLTEGKFEPKTPLEKGIYQNTQDITNMFIGPTSGFTQAVRKVVVPTVANIGKHILKEFGFSEKTQEYVKAGLTLGLDLAGSANARAHSEQLLNNATRNIRPYEIINVQNANRELQTLRNSLERGMGQASESKRNAINIIDRFMERQQNGNMSLREAVEFRNDINRIRDELGAFDLPHGTREAAVRNVEQAYNHIGNNIETYARANNPEFWDNYQRGQEAYAVTQQSNKVANFVQKNISKFTGSKAGTATIAATVASLFGIKHLPTYAGVVAKAPYLGAGLGAMAATYKSTQLLYRIYNSPELLRYYSGVIENSLRGNSVGMMKNLKLLDEKVKEEEKNPPKKPPLK